MGIPQCRKGGTVGVVEGARGRGKRPLEVLRQKGG